MNVGISLRVKPIHRRINPADPEYQPAEPTIEVNNIEKKLVEMFRELDNRDKTQIMRDVSLSFMAAKRVRHNDKERGMA